MPLHEVTDKGLRHHEAGAFKALCLAQCAAYVVATSADHAGICRFWAGDNHHGVVAEPVREHRLRCVRLVPYDIEGRVLLDIQQVLPLPQAADYQVRLRRKDAAR